MQNYDNGGTCRLKIPFMEIYIGLPPDYLKADALTAHMPNINFDKVYFSVIVKVIRREYSHINRVTFPFM